MSSLCGTFFTPWGSSTYSVKLPWRSSMKSESTAEDLHGSTENNNVKSVRCISPCQNVQCTYRAIVLPIKPEALELEPLSLILGPGINPFTSRFIFRTDLTGPLEPSQLKYPIKEEQRQLNFHTSYLFVEIYSRKKKGLYQAFIQIETPSHGLLTKPIIL